MSLAQELDSLAISLISEFGEAATFTKVVPGVYTPSTQSVATTTTTYTGNIVPSNFNSTDIDGTLILMSDTKILAHSMTAVPEVNDTVTVSSKTLKIVAVMLTKVTGTTVLYTLQGRS